MPTILRIEGYRFFFYSLEPGEPPHVHVEHAGKTAKYWLEPVELASSDGFRGHELTRLHQLVLANGIAFRRRWNEHFGIQSGSG